MPIIQCPECDKKLKLKTIKEGAKVKCPSCGKIFRPQAIDGEPSEAKPKKRRPSTASRKSTSSAGAQPVKKRPAKRKRPAPVDDYDDHGSDAFDGDDFDDVGGDSDYDAPSGQRSQSSSKKTSKKKKKKLAPTQSKKPLIIGVAVVAIAAVSGGVFLQWRASVQEADRKQAAITSHKNMKTIALAMLNFDLVHQRFPSAAGPGPEDASGRPMKKKPRSGEGLSWRVHLLPFLDGVKLYNQFALDEPWDSPQNRPLVEKMPDVFASSGANIETGKTVYLVPVGDGTLFGEDEGLRLRDITDGTANTILMVEVVEEKAVYWTQPLDYNVDPADPFRDLVVRNGIEIPLLFCDGRVKKVSAEVDRDTANHLFQVDDGFVIELSRSPSRQEELKKN